MRGKGLLAGLAVYILLGAVGVRGWSGTIAGVAFEEMVADDAIFYVSVPNVREAVTKFKETNTYRIIQELNLAKLAGKHEEFREVNQFYDRVLKPLTEILDGRIAVAVGSIPPQAGIPEVMLLADVEGKEEVLRQYIGERICPLLGEACEGAVSFERGGYDVRQLSVGGRRPVVVCYAIADGVFVATLGRGAMEELLDKPRRDDCLGRSKLFQEVRRKVGERCDLFMYADFSKLVERIGPGFPGEAKALLKATGLIGVKAVGIGAEVQGAAIRQTFFLATGRERGGLLGMLARKGSALKAAGYIPEGATIFYTVSLGDFCERWDDLMSIVREAVESTGGQQAWERVVASLSRGEKEIGFKIREDILAPFAGEVCVAAKLPELMGLPSIWLLIEVKDAGKAEVLMEKLIMALERSSGGPVVRSKEERKGVEITSLTVLPPKGKGVQLGAMFMARPAYAIVGDFLVVGMHSTMVKNVVDVYRGGRSLKDDPEFKRVLGKLPRMGMAAGYVDLKRVYDFVYSSVMVLALGRVGPDLTAMLARVGQHLGSSGGVAWCDDSGIGFESFSDSGLEQVVLVYPVVAGVMAFGRAKAQAQAAMCANNLRQLALGCIMYSEDHSGVLPGKLSELYPDYVPDLEIFVCPVHKGKRISKDRIDEESDYKLEMGNMRLAGVKEASRSIMILERERNHSGGRNAAFADGHVQRIGGKSEAKAGPMVEIGPALVSSREEAWESACLGNVRQLAQACAMYANDEGRLPGKLGDLYPGYVGSLEVFVCPANEGKKVRSDHIEEDSDYRLVLGGMELAKVKDPAGTALIVEKEPRHGGRKSVAYADFHVESVRGSSVEGK